MYCIHHAVIMLKKQLNKGLIMTTNRILPGETQVKCTVVIGFIYCVWGIITTSIGSDVVHSEML